MRPAHAGAGRSRGRAFHLDRCWTCPDRSTGGHRGQRPETVQSDSVRLFWCWRDGARGSGDGGTRPRGAVDRGLGGPAAVGYFLPWSITVAWAAAEALLIASRRCRRRSRRSSASSSDVVRPGRARARADRGGEALIPAAASCCATSPPRARPPRGGRAGGRLAGPGRAAHTGRRPTGRVGGPVPPPLPRVA